MWYVWTVLVVTSAVCEAAPAKVSPEGGVATTARPPPRTLDRQAAELAWHSWLQSSESGNLNAPPRRITTKSLFMTPLICPKGDRNGCLQLVTVNKDDHEEILKDELSAHFQSSPDNIQYDDGNEDPGPFQFSIPIGLEPLAAPLQSQDSILQSNPMDGINFVKKDVNKPNIGSAIEAELERLKLQQAAKIGQNNTTDKILVAQNTLTYPEKPKRDSPMINSTSMESLNNNTDADDQGQKELVFGHVNVDPVVYNTNPQTDTETDVKDTAFHLDLSPIETKTTEGIVNMPKTENTVTIENRTQNKHESPTSDMDKTKENDLKKNENTKLKPENDYTDIGEAIKLISRYAEVTTDDNFSKDLKKYTENNENYLGTRTRLHHRRIKPKTTENEPIRMDVTNENREPPRFYPKISEYYRYPWPSQHAQTPPPDYPFRHLQDYWPGKNHFGGVYRSGHGNPRRHHHSYPYNYFRPHGEFGPKPVASYQAQMATHQTDPLRSRTNNRDLYSLLGLRHWLSESTSKR